MTCRDDLEIPVDPHALVGFLRREIEQHKGTISGDLDGFAVSVPTPLGTVGGYGRLVGPTLVSIEVTKTPRGVSCAMVRAKLVHHLTEAVARFVRQQGSMALSHAAASPERQVDG